MDISEIQYIQINIFGITVLILMMLYAAWMHTSDMDKSETFFKAMLVTNIIVLISDSGILIMRDHTSQFSFIVSHVFCIVYYLLHAFFGEFWLGYCIRRLFPEKKFNIVSKIILSLPSIICGVIIISSPWTKMIYTLTDNNYYQRGEYMWIVIMFSYFYWCVSAIITMVELFTQKRNRERSLYTTIFLFPIPTIIGNIVQLKFYGLTIIWICSTISLFMLFAESQHKKMSRDPLTNLYNRRRINNQIEWEISHISSKENLYAIIIDIDNFKNINDKFGHVEGDKAIVAVANVIRSSVSKTTFIGRLGGDEYIIIGIVKNKDMVKQFLKRLDEETQKFNETNTLKYNLTVSAGYAMFGINDNPSIDKVISTADKEMYKIKTMKKVG